MSSTRIMQGLNETIYQSLQRVFGELIVMDDRSEKLRLTARADDERLMAAAEKAGVSYFGCDTPDHLAEEILILREVVRRLKEVA